MNDSLPWTRKHATKGSSGIVGQKAAVAALKSFVSGYKGGRKKSAILYGLSGCGKTASVYAIAKDLGYEVVEVNASDFRDAKSLTSVLGPASSQLSLFGKGKIMLVDELDGISGQKDRGGIPALVKLAANSAFPVVITANDPWGKKFAALRRASEMVEFMPIDSETAFSLLQKICRAEGVNAEEAALKTLADRSGGDLRGLITDLQILSGASKRLSRADVDQLSDRNRAEAITKALVKIFRNSDFGIASTALDEVDEQPNEWFLWIDENLPSEYRNPNYLARAYHYLSSADVFSRRIARNQYWRFLVYIKLLLSAGVAMSKDGKLTSVMDYRRTSRLLKLYIAKNRYNRRKSIAEKIALNTHTSAAKVIKDFHYYKAMIKSSSRIAGELNLDREEVEWLSK